MITGRFVVALVLFGCGIPYVVDAEEGGAEDTKRTATDVLSAADFVQAALEAESTGNGADRAQYLKEALLQDPNYAPARWQSGYLQTHDKWLTIAEMAAQNRADTRLAGYQQFRASLPESPQRDLLLGRWCQEQNLTDQATFHWRNVLETDPYHSEALQALGVRWYNGELIPADEVTKRKKSDFQAARTASTRVQRMKDTIARWENVAANNPTELQAQMATDLAAEKSRLPIPTFNYLLCERCSDTKAPAACEIVNRTWVHLLAQDRSNTKYLVMHAIGHPLESVRLAAADELQKLPRKDYVPLLLESARFPAEFAWSLLVTGGIVRAEYTVDVQGMDADTEFEHVDSIEFLDDLFPFDLLYVRSKDFPQLNADRVAVKEDSVSRKTYPRQLAMTTVTRAHGIQNLVDQYNAKITEINFRVKLALERATGEDLDASPRSWRTWWNEYVCDVYEVETVQTGLGQNDNNQDRGPDNQGGRQPNAVGQQPERPLYQFTSQNWLYNRPRPSQHHLLQMSCFSTDTPVWTITGPRPIAEILPGDQVLAQNATTGELAFKTVELVTKRQPSPLIRITVDGDEILATRGHPFWVVGKRWTMAKHIQAGDLLHTVSGSLPVVKVEELPTPEAWYEFAYNLQVADFHTYFVGEKQMLVHHMSMLSILDEGSSIVPGL